MRTESPSPSAARTPPLLEVKSLVKHYKSPAGGALRRKEKRYVSAVENVSFSLEAQKTLGIVGESGCGKSTLARLLCRLQGKTGGSVYFQGREIFSLGGQDLRIFRREVQIIFQDAYASLNPHMTAGELIAEGLEVHKLLATDTLRRRRAGELMELVGLNPDHARRYPHQFSGGQHQRIGIARALAVEPRLIVCDEPVSALDVSIQAQVINLLASVQAEFGLACVLISHDLSVVRHFCDRVAVMYLGKVVEIGTKSAVLDHPTHPYTRALLSAQPGQELGSNKSGSRIVLQGEVPSPTDPPSGCRFRTRCWKAEAVCAEEAPPLVHRGADHYSACHFPES